MLDSDGQKSGWGLTLSDTVPLPVDWHAYAQAGATLLSRTTHASGLDVCAPLCAALIERRLKYEPITTLLHEVDLRDPMIQLNTGGPANDLELALMLAAAALQRQLEARLIILKNGRESRTLLEISSNHLPRRTPTGSEKVRPPAAVTLDPRFCAVSPDWACSFDIATRSALQVISRKDWQRSAEISITEMWQAHLARQAEATSESVTLPPDWIFAGGQGVGHFLPAAKARRNDPTGVDVFAGRETALSRILDYCAVRGTIGSPLVVTGGAGSGKSCVVARSIALLGRRVTRGLAFHGRSSTVQDLISAIASILGTADATERGLFAQLSKRGREQGSIVIIVDALDEMLTRHDQVQSAGLLHAVSQYPGIRMVVGVRREGPFGSRFDNDQEELIRRLHGGTRVALSSIVDLDTRDYFELRDLQLAIAAALTRGTDYGDGAWTQYRGSPELRDAMAERIAHRAGSSFFVAISVAESMASEEQAVDPLAPGFNEADLPDGVDQLLDSSVARLPWNDRDRATALLTVLAYGRGSGLTASRWLKFAEALGEGTLTHRDIRWLRQSQLASFLTISIKDNQELFRLYHISLVDALKRRRSVLDDEGEIVLSLLGYGWKDPYNRRYFPAHVLAAARACDFFAEPELLVNCKPNAVLPLLSDVGASDLSDAYLLALPFLDDNPENNRQALFLAANAQGAQQLSRHLDPGRNAWGPLHFRFGRLRRSTVSSRIIPGHRGPVTDIAFFRDAGKSRLLTCSMDGSARVWDIEGAEAKLIGVYSGHDGPVYGIACLDWPNLPHAAVITVGAGGNAHIWDPHSPGAGLRRFHKHEGPVYGVLTCPWPGLDHPAIVTVGSDAVVLVWDPRGGHDEDILRLPGHEGSILACALLQPIDAPYPLILTAGEDGTARVWQQGDATMVLRGHSGAVTGIAGTDSRSVITASDDGRALIWSTPWTHPSRQYDGHRGRLRNVTSARLDSWGELACTSADDGSAHLLQVKDERVQRVGLFDAASSGILVTKQMGVNSEWFASGTQNGQVLLWRAKDASILLDNTDRTRCGVVLMNSADSMELVTAGSDGVATIWQRNGGRLKEMGTFRGHSDWIRDMETLPWPGIDHEVVASASGDGTVQIWDPYEPSQPLLVHNRHSAPIRSVRRVRWRGTERPRLLTASADGTVRLWDPHAASESGELVATHSDIVRAAIPWQTTVRGVEVVTVSGGTVNLWEMTEDGSNIISGRTLSSLALRDAAEVSDGTNVRFLAVVGNDGVLRVLDPSDSFREHASVKAHDDWIWGVSYLERSREILTVSGEGTLRVWRLSGTSLEARGRLSLLSAGLFVRSREQWTLVTTSKGFLVFDELDGDL